MRRYALLQTQGLPIPLRDKNNAKSVKILFASSEAQPLIKTGGLADVSGALPAALRRLRHDARLMIPAYPVALQRARGLERVASIEVPGAAEPVNVLLGQLPNAKLPVYLIDSPAHFMRAGDPYRASNGQDWQDNAQRFAVFSRAIALLCEAGLDWVPDIVHCNDWQTGLAPALLALRAERPRTVFTIHNMAYQGLFPASTVQELSLPPELWTSAGLEFYGMLSFIKGGIAYADHLTTVSPSYAAEIRTPAFGYGLEGLLNYRAGALSGILNGIDTKTWDPQTDRLLVHHYGREDFAGKWLGKQLLQEQLGLNVDGEAPLLGHIGRMVEQKGIDLILEACDDLLAGEDVQLALLGSGEARFEDAARALADKYPGRCGLRIGYDEALAHQIEAGADLFLMPSRFEPCGLNQMYSLRYGTLPVVRRTGGLSDTVVDTNALTLADGSATGFVFEPATPLGLRSAIERALEVYADQSLWQTLMRRGMEQDFSWEQSARQYLALYRELLD
jgi:starch synthase